MLNKEDQVINKYTFWQLLSSLEVEIPIIQRDYAQGRKSRETDAIREELLDSIYFALKNDRNLDFDFVYGTSTGTKLCPLDGQQRLTTFFLLHWYLSAKEGRLGISRPILRNFSYYTRPSSKDFCQYLLSIDYSPEIDGPPMEFIKDGNGYFRAWDTDPTIRHMLIMLNDIHSKFCDFNPIFDDLISESKQLLTFNFLSIENYALTDDLYIKMNARGKSLSDFENFKAKFIQSLKEQGLDHKTFEKSIDSTWTDLLWEYRDSKTNTIDEQFLNFFTFLTEMLFLERAEQQDGDSPFSPKDIRGLISFYDSDSKLQELYSLLNLWKDKTEITTFLDSVFYNGTHQTGKVKVFDMGIDLFGAVTKREANLIHEVMLFSIMKRCLKYKNAGVIDSCLNDFARIVRNLILKSRSFIRKQCNFTTDFRFCRHGIPFLHFVNSYLIDMKDIYKEISLLKLDEIEEKINMESLSQEIDKSILISENQDKKEEIQKLEDMPMFRSCLHNILDYVKENDCPGLADDLEITFTSDMYIKLIRALISIGDIRISLGNCAYGERYYLGDPNDWYVLLTYVAHDRNEYADNIKQFLLEYFSTEATGVEESLAEIVSNHENDFSKEDWQYYFIKYPETVSNYPGYIDTSRRFYAFENIYGSYFAAHRLNGKDLRAYHIEAIYLECANQLGSICVKYYSGFTGNPEDVERGLELSCGIGVGIGEEGSLYLYDNKGGELGNVIENSYKQFDKLKTEDMDWVEKIVNMSQIVENNYQKHVDSFGKER